MCDQRKRVKLDRMSYEDYLGVKLDEQEDLRIIYNLVQTTAAGRIDGSAHASADQVSFSSSFFFFFLHSSIFFSLSFVIPPPPILCLPASIHLERTLVLKAIEFFFFFPPL